MTDNLKLAKQEIDEAVARGDNHVALSEEAVFPFITENPNKAEELFKLLTYANFLGFKFVSDSVPSMSFSKTPNIGTTREGMTRGLPLDGMVLDAKGVINIDPKDLVIDYCNPIGGRLTPEQKEHFKNVSEQARNELLFLDEGLVWMDRLVPKPQRDALSMFLRKTNAAAKQEKKDYGWYRKFERGKKWN